MIEREKTNRRMKKRVREREKKNTVKLQLRATLTSMCLLHDVAACE